jgi:valyl-tRNA synthetase
MIAYFMANKGLVDLDVEIAKCEKKADLARLTLEKITRVESQEDYQETVPANVRALNEDKVGGKLTLKLNC